MDKEFYSQLTRKGIAKEPLSKKVSSEILTSGDIELLPLLNAAFAVRRKYFGNEVRIHIINNAQNGCCSQDCGYCAQSKDSESEINEYPMKSDEQIIAEARSAYENGAFRYCMVFSGKQLSRKRTEHLSKLIRKIKSKYPLEVCVSHGQLDKKNALILKEAGLDRLNHNLNTSRRFYPQICSTHTYQDRLTTLKSAHDAGLQVCSGVIVGMGETPDDIFETACVLRDLKVESIPVNFFIPIEGIKLNIKPDLSPEYCLRVLCLYRFLNSDAEIRIAAGWEIYFRSMQVMAFYPANSMFLGGYLNTPGESKFFIFQMIKDAGFNICSDYSLDELIQNEKLSEPKSSKDNNTGSEMPKHIVKLLKEKKYYGRMNDPVSSAHIKGICGDEMEIYLVIKNNVIEGIKFYTSGCINSVFCGTATAHLAAGKTINEVLKISPVSVIEELKCLPQDHRHCAILAVSTLHKAIADYWLKT